MNRQKKELLKKIDELETWIAVDTALGCGFAPPGAYDGMYQEIYRLQEKLAHLRHYKTVENMMYDERGTLADDQILQRIESNWTRKQRQPRNQSKDRGR